MPKKYTTHFNSYLLTEENALYTHSVIHSICNVCQMHCEAEIKITG